MSKNTGDGELELTFSDLVRLVRKEYSNERDNIGYNRAAKIVDKAISPQLAQEANKARLGLLTELLDELKELEQLYNGPAGELARVGGKDSGLKYLRALTADFEDRKAQLTKEKESSDE